MFSLCIVYLVSICMTHESHVVCSHSTAILNSRQTFTRISTLSLSLSARLPSLWVSSCQILLSSSQSEKSSLDLRRENLKSRSLAFQKSKLRHILSQVLLPVQHDVFIVVLVFILVKFIKDLRASITLLCLLTGLPPTTTSSLWPTASLTPRYSAEDQGRDWVEVSGQNLHW